MATAYQVGDRVPSTGLYAPFGDQITDSTPNLGGSTQTVRTPSELHRTLIEGSIFPDVPELGPNVRWFRLA